MNYTLFDKISETTIFTTRHLYEFKEYGYYIRPKIVETQDGNTTDSHNEIEFCGMTKEAKEHVIECLGESFDLDIFCEEELY